MTTTQHPWTIPADAGDDTDDTGDPRDMAVPAVRRFELGHDIEGCRHERDTDDCFSCVLRRHFRRAEIFAMRAEPLIRSAAMTVEEAFAEAGGGTLEKRAARMLWHRWSYGERFWVWWQGLPKPLDFPKPHTIAPLRDFPGVTERERRRLPPPDPPALRYDSSDPRPVIVLSDGTERRADEVWQATVYGFGHLAIVDGACFTAYGNTRWVRNDEVERAAAATGEARRCVYPTPDAPRFDHGDPGGSAQDDPRPVLTLADGSTVRADEVWTFGDGSQAANADGLAYGGDGGRWTSLGAGFLWTDANAGKGNRVYPPAEAKPTTLPAPPGPARNAPIRVGDYVRVREQGGRRNFDFWARVTDAASEYTRCVALDGACEYNVPLASITDHRPAPRITLPDGREVVAERMWRSTSATHVADAYANVDGRPFHKLRATGTWVSGRGGPWGAGLLGDHAERVWPPANIEDM